ncbi:MAG: type II secretion system F family protein [Gammaproteobacteria bacterium]|nr:MAG: type II secretion system F family protein [Gammaproteobacteria bacterium]
MALFHYIGRGRSGERLEGEVEAATADAVASQLLNAGVTPLRIEPGRAVAGTVGGLWERLHRRPPSLDDIILLTRQLYSLVRAGVPINRAMQSLIESTRNPVLVEVLRDVLTRLESGHELAPSLARHPEVFSTLYVSMVRVGENSGRLEESLLRIANYLDLEKETRARVKTALRYPSFVLIAIGISVTILNIFVIPAFKNFFDRAGAELPLPTRVIMATSDFFVTYWPHMAVVLAGLILGFRYWVGTESGRYQWDRMKLRIPIAGDIILRATLGRFARAFAMATGAGVPLVQALGLLSKAVDNEYIGEAILGMRNGIERGESLIRTARASGMFTPLVLQMLAVGEETGAVDEMMEEVAGFYEREVDYDIRNLSATIEPIMIVLIGGMVLVLALGIFLPMWDLARVALGRGG